MDVVLSSRMEAILPWVYEFFVNARFHSDGDTMVRGKPVDFSAAAIGSFFDLPHVDWEEFEKGRANVSPSIVAAALCPAGEVRWARPSKFVLDSANFTRPAKVWLMFVNTNIMPTKHANHVSIERAYLVYCILHGTPVPVGKIIFDQLNKKLKTNGGQKLWFPTLITELCRHAGVPLLDDDTRTPVGHHISEKVISSYIKQQPKPPTSSEPSSSKPTTSKKAAPADSPSDLHLKYLKYLVYHQRYHHRYVDAYLDFIHDEQVRLTEHAKLPVIERAFPFNIPFDDKGYLIDRSGKRFPPYEDAEDSPDDDANDDDDEADDDDGDSTEDEEDE